jgi:hypothetical protein
MKEKILNLLLLLPIEYNPPVMSHNVAVVQTQLANAEKCLQAMKMLCELPELIIEIRLGQPVTCVKYNQDRFVFEIDTMSGLDSFSNPKDRTRSIDFLETEILKLKKLLDASIVIKEATCT